MTKVDGDALGGVKDKVGGYDLHHLVTKREQSNSHNALIGFKPCFDVLNGQPRVCGSQRIAMLLSQQMA